MNEQVFTITTSACAVSLVISTPSFSSVPTITSASTRFLAQPSEIKPTRTGRSMESCFIKDRSPYVRETLGATLGVWGLGAAAGLLTKSHGCLGDTCVDRGGKGEAGAPLL